MMRFVLAFITARWVQGKDDPALFLLQTHAEPLQVDLEGSPWVTDEDLMNTYSIETLKGLFKAGVFSSRRDPNQLSFTQYRIRDSVLADKVLKHLEKTNGEEAEFEKTGKTAGAQEVGPEKQPNQTLRWEARQGVEDVSEQHSPHIREAILVPDASRAMAAPEAVGADQKGTSDSHTNGSTGDHSSAIARRVNFLQRKIGRAVDGMAWVVDKTFEHLQLGL